MVLPRRHHARPTRRRNLAGTALACSVVFYIVYAWPSSRFFGTPSNSPGVSTSSHSHTSSSFGPPGALPQAHLLSGSPPRWRDPHRDFDAEYEQVLEAVPALRGTRQARIAFLIMAHGPTDVIMLKRSLPWLYSPLNLFLVSSSRCVVSFRRPMLESFGARNDIETGHFVLLYEYLLRFSTVYDDAQHL